MNKTSRTPPARDKASLPPTKPPSSKTASTANPTPRLHLTTIRSCKATACSRATLRNQQDNTSSHSKATARRSRSRSSMVRTGSPPSSRDMGILRGSRGSMRRRRRQDIRYACPEGSVLWAQSGRGMGAVEKGIPCAEFGLACGL